MPPPTPAGVLNQDLTLTAGVTYLLWTRVENTGEVDGGTGFIWQYNHQSAGWTAITTSSVVVRAVPAVTFLNDADVPETLTGSGTYVTNNDAASEDGTTTLPANFPADGAVEFVLSFSIQTDAPGLANGQTGQIRLAQTGGVALDSYTETFDYTVNIAVDVTALPTTRALALGAFDISFVTGEPWSDGTFFDDGQGWLPLSTDLTVPITGSIALSGLQPTLGLNHILTPTTRALTVVGEAPNVTASNTFQADTGLAILTLSPRLPAISAGHTLAPGISARAITGRVPILSLSSAALPSVANLVTAGSAPIPATGNKTFAPNLGGIAFSGYEPDIFVASDSSIDIEYDILGSVIDTETVAGSAHVAVMAVSGSVVQTVSIQGEAVTTVVAIAGSMSAETVP